MPFAPERTVLLSVREEPIGLQVAKELPHVVVTNSGPSAVFVRSGTGVQVAVPHGDLPVLPHTQLLLTKGVGADFVSAVCGAGEAAEVYITVGTGS